jgi:hypothetical protein
MIDLIGLMKIYRKNLKLINPYYSGYCNFSTCIERLTDGNLEITLYIETKCKTDKNAEKIKKAFHAQEVHFLDDSYGDDTPFNYWAIVLGEVFKNDY